jgi:hypothetical protein
MSIIYLLAKVSVRCNGEKLYFALSIKFNKLVSVSVSLSFSMLSCQSEFGHHVFLVFLLASSIAMSSSRQFLQLLLPILLQPRWVWLRFAKTLESAQYDWAYGHGASGYSGLGGIVRTSNASGKDMHGPMSSAIQARWPYHRRVHARRRLKLSLHVSGVRTVPAPQTTMWWCDREHRPSWWKRWWPTCVDEQGCRHGRRSSSDPSRPSNAR